MKIARVEALHCDGGWRPWKEIAQVAQDLMARRYPGKAVLVVD